MLERLTRDADAHIAHVSEVRKSLLTRDVVLTEDDLSIGSMFGRPGADPPFKATTQAIPVMRGKSALHLLQQRHWPQTGHRLEHGADLSVPEPEKGISRSASQSWLAVFQGWQVVRTFDTATGPFAEPALAAATGCGWWRRKSMNSLFCW